MKSKASAQQDNEAPPKPKPKGPDIAIICELIKNRFQQDFSQYKNSCLQRRILERMEACKQNNFEDYVRLLQSSESNELEQLYENILISFTCFFSDIDAFNFLQKTLIPSLFVRAIDDLRIWVPACSTGEEAFSLAILFEEAKEKYKSKIEYTIFATDLNEESIIKAREGTYSSKVQSEVSSARLQKFFTKTPTGFKVKESLKRNCVFAKHHLGQNYPYSNIDLISCRNLLISLEKDFQGEIFKTFHYALKPRSFLFLGSAESATPQEGLFEKISSQYKVFKKVSSLAAIDRLENDHSKEDRQLEKAVSQIIRDKYTPAHVVVDEVLNVHYLSAGLGEYLAPAQGKPSTQLLKLIRPELRPGLRQMISKTLRTQETGRKDHLIPGSSGKRSISVVTGPVLLENEESHFALILFQEHLASKSQSRSELSKSEEEHSVLLSSIQDLKLVNQELESVNNDLESLFKNAELLTLFLDEDLRIKKFTPAAKAFFHFRESDLERPITDLALNLKDFSFKKNVKQVLGTLEKFEEIVSTKNEEQWLKVQIIPYRKINKVVSGVIVTLNDITTMKTFQKELSLSLRQQTFVAKLGIEAVKDNHSFDELISNVAQEVLEMLDGDYAWLFQSNESATKLSVSSSTGVLPIGNSIQDLKLKEGDFLQFALLKKSVVHIKDFFKDDGHGIPEFFKENHIRSAITASVIGANDQACGIIGVFSKKPNAFPKESEGFISSVANTLSIIASSQQLKKDKMLFAQVFEGTTDTVSTENLNSVITTWNPACEKIYGHSAQEAIGRSIFDFLIPEDYFEEAHAAYERVTSTLESITFDTKRITAGGELIEVSIILSPLINRKKLVGFATIGRDITEAKMAQQALVQAKRESDSASELKSRFMGVLSHELRTPLSAVIGFAELVQRSLQTGSQSYQYIQKVLGNAKLLESLVADILDISKIEEGKFSFHLEWFDPKKTFESYVSALSLNAHKKNLTLHVRTINKAPARIKSDSQRLRQIMTNLISNAIKYTKHGQVEVVIKYPDEERPHDLIVFVRDTGIGIAKKKQKELFAPFFRADPGKGEPGIGLGLYLARQLARLLHGDLVLSHSTLNKGSEFQLTIPVETSEEIEAGADCFAGAEQTQQSANQKSLTGKRILLADDSCDLRALYCTFLKLAGAQVDGANDGQEAWEIFQGQEYDLVLADLYMPKLNGDELLEKIRSCSKVPVVALSAHVIKSAEDKKRMSKFTKYLSKPIDQQTLVSSVTQVFDS